MDAAPSKKRGADRQITKDDRVEEEEEEEQDAPPSELGTFKRASDEVLATRKIVKVRRTTAASAPSAPSGPNLFANIQLVAPAVPHSSTPGTTGADSAIAGSGEVLLEGEKGGEENENGNGKAKKGEEQVVEEAVVENGGKEIPQQDDTGKAPAAAVAAAPKSFDQVSSTNAFGSFSSSGFSFSTLTSGSSFSFGSSSSPSVGFGSFTSSTTTFEATKGSQGFPSLFGNPGSSSSDSGAASSHHSHPTVSLTEVPTETGEEKEKAAFSGDGILYEFVDKSWKERGKGELKLNLCEESRRARLVMRSRGNLKLLLNASLFPDMRISKMDGRSVTFACVNTATAKEANTLTTYAVKLRDAAGIPEFLELVEMYKGVKGVPEHKDDVAAVVEERGEKEEDEKRDVPDKEEQGKVV